LEKGRHEEKVFTFPIGRLRRKATSMEPMTLSKKALSLKRAERGDATSRKGERGGGRGRGEREREREREGEKGRERERERERKRGKLRGRLGGSRGRGDSRLLQYAIINVRDVSLTYLF
jgi:hypothetical protein